MLDATTTEAFFGIVIAAYSLAQIVSAPLLGYWSNRVARLKPPLILCAIVMFFGNIMYFIVPMLPNNHKYYLMAARFVTGIGASNIGLLKAYASAASVSKDRSRAIAFVTGGMALGTTFGPAFQVLFSWLGYPGWQLGDNFAVSMFNAPALLACCMNIATLVLLCTLFKESFAGVADASLKKNKKQKNSTLTDNNLIQLPSYDRKAAAICYALRFTQMFVVTNLETIGSSFAMMMFAWTPTEVVRYSSLAHAAKSLLAFAVYFAYIVFNLGKRMNERMVCLVSTFGMLAFHVFTYSYPFLPNTVVTFNNSVAFNRSLAVGCNVDVYEWCSSLTQVNIIVYYFFYILVVGIGFSNINVAMNTLFSKIIGPRLQGTQQGILQMSGGSARMLGPLLVGYLYSEYGPRLVWIVESVVIGSMSILWIASYRRLVPLEVPLGCFPDTKSSSMRTDSTQITQTQTDSGKQAHPDDLLDKSLKTNEILIESIVPEQKYCSERQSNV
ncbi:major facilitator superfamily domain-containing protein [Ditylenchus destructor]|nr:major facilitator superfamily domain-containing protein [Ditylenchus destructor]